MGKTALVLLIWLVVAQQAVLLDQLRSAPASQWDSLLAAHRSEVYDRLLRALGDRCTQSISQNRLEDARADAELADYVDYYRGTTRHYEARAQFALGKQLLEGHQTDAVLALANSLLSSHPGDYHAHLLLGMTYRELNDLPRAIEHLKAATAARPNQEEPHMLLAIVYVTQEDSAGALAEFHEVLRINPDNAVARDAVSALSGQTPSGDLPANRLALEFFNQAEEHFRRHQYAQAIEGYQKALQADPKFAKAYLFMGDCYLANGDRQQAIANYQKAVELNPRDRQAYRFLGDAYEKWFDQTKDVQLLDKAIDCY